MVSLSALWVREKRKEYHSGSDKSGSVDQVEAGKGCEGRWYECGVLCGEPVLIVEHKVVSLRLIAHGIGVTKALKRPTRN